jgi:iron complex transport system ATP-binding protein
MSPADIGRTGRTGSAAGSTGSEISAASAVSAGLSIGAASGYAGNAPLMEAIAIEAGYKAQRGLPGAQDKLVVHGAGFQALPGRLLAILGANGCGKTTLLKTCIGLLPPLGGRALLGGQDVTSLSPRKRARIAAWVPQHSESAWSFTAREVVSQGRFASLGPFAPFRPEDAEAVDDAIEALDLRELADQSFSRLSGGEARRVLIARALAQDTPLLALDEPAAHLDPGRQMELMESLASLAKAGKAVAVSLHDVNSARRFADDVLLIDRQGRCFFGPPESVLSPERLEDAYDTEFLHGDHAGYGRYVLPLARKKKGKPSS